MQDSSHELVHQLRLDPYAIGYSGIGLLKDGGIRALPIAPKAGEPFVEPTPENIASGAYPLSRFLYLYVNKAPGRPLPRVEREFLQMVLSPKGQAGVIKSGFVPLSTPLVTEEFAKLD